MDRRQKAQPEAGFYKNLLSFHAFSDVTELAHYHPAPADWLVVVADVAGSTDAILAGRYKDVNMIGAATITAVVNVTRAHEIPYVFGGDGATLVIPPETFDRVRSALLKTKDMALAQFGLTLRVGAVPVHRLRAAKTEVLVAKYRLSPGNWLAMFTGGGVGLADRLIKEDDGTGGYAMNDPVPEGRLDLEGLSCRWQPLTARRGTMLSMLIRALPQDAQPAAAVYRDIMKRLEIILGTAVENAKPVDFHNTRLRWPPPGLASEIKTRLRSHGLIPAVLAAYVSSLTQALLHLFGLKLGAYNAPAYKKELIDNSDFRRFDDTMRIVLDCTLQEKALIEKILAEFRAKGLIAYGLHEADSALMTCLVFNLSDHEHVHFIDGADGGFAIAARQLKQQLANPPAG